MIKLEAFKPSDGERSGLLDKLKSNGVNHTEIVYFAKEFKDDNLLNVVICYREKNPVVARGEPAELTKLFKC